MNLNMNFEDIKKDWQTQPVAATAESVKIRPELKSKWEKHQQRVLRTNICMSLGFLAAMIGIAWVYFSFEDEYQWPFKVSVAAFYVLMLVYAAVSWRSYAFKKENYEDSSKDYVNYQIRKLSWQRKLITTYSWIYMVLLWVALTMYIIEITTGGSALFRYSALGISTLYIVSLNIWSRKKKQSKQLTAIDHLTADFEAIKKKIIIE
ncbi:hypothetical protein [Pedobacter immunditicola]|uniref:hypothetical protein n=1 Tax=Pedobacter immunditicola TaxID=3133440 RepID=UPI0030B73E52